MRSARTMRRLAALAIAAVAGITLLPATPALADLPTTTVTVDGAAQGPTFYGVGAISGGGGNSVYLKDYPEPERTDILNYLFSPDYGADLQVLKVEIGGDTNSTDGSEPSIEHAQGSIDCDSGYEWWLMEQAQERNPNIVFYGLQWAAPSWVAGAQLKPAPATTSSSLANQSSKAAKSSSSNRSIGSGKPDRSSKTVRHVPPSTNHDSLWTQADVDYVMDWMRCASSHDLKVSYLGGWNESGWNTTWYEKMRAALNSAGYKHTQLVAADSFPHPTSTVQGAVSTWNVAKTLRTNRAFNKSVGVLGAHDVCGYPTTGYTCTTTETARTSGKPLWASELGHMDGNTGAADMIRSIVNGYDQANLSGFLTWPLVSAMPKILPKSNYGLINADQPWNGGYSVNEMTWAIAQVTQFTSPGWHYVDGANQDLAASGSFNTLEGPGHSNWSLIAQTSTATAAQGITVNLSGGLAHSLVNVWTTDLNGGPDKAIVKQPVVIPHGTSFTYTLQPGYIYTFSTLSAPGGARKGTATKSADAPLSLPYSDSLTVPDKSPLPIGQMPAYFAPQDGAFQYVPCIDEVDSYCVQQTAVGNPVGWPGAYDVGGPYALFGNTGSGWQNYTVSADVLFPQAGTARLLARVGSRALRDPARFDGYEFTLSDRGKWSVLRNSLAGPAKALASGTLAVAPGLHTEVPMSLTVTGQTITATVGVAQIWTGTDATYTNGMAGIGTGTGLDNDGFYPVQFTDFAIAPSLSMQHIKTAGLR